MPEESTISGATMTPPPVFDICRPREWFKFFGPGAVIASLTIGAGELIFSSRAGAIFGYRVLWFFTLILLFKWVLVYVSGRQMIITGSHPFEQWMDLPGLRGWFPSAFFLLALICFPIWVGFHAGTVGTLLARLAGTENHLRGSSHYLWGLGVLGIVMILACAGGYRALEKIQLVIVILMLASCFLAVIMLKPDWLDFLKGFIVPGRLAYPDWVNSITEMKGRPVWVEVVTYVGVLGGSGYDYLAYVSYLRDKRWGRAGSRNLSANEVIEDGGAEASMVRGWLRVLAIDSALSFVSVLLFSAVFVACGAILLGPEHQLPAGGNLLTLQASFVTAIHPWLTPVYFLGAFLTMFGTLYGTIEVAPAILRELWIGLKGSVDASEAGRLRNLAVLWCGLGGSIVLMMCLASGYFAKTGTPPGLVAMLTPANLFTGVLACGLICLLNWWGERRFLPPSWRPSGILMSLNLVGGAAFFALGIKAYWDHSRWVSFLLFGGTIASGWGCAWLLRRFVKANPRYKSAAESVSRKSVH